MHKLAIALLAAVLVAIVGFLACTGTEKDERRAGASTVAAAGQAPAQQKPAEKDADEDEEEGAKNPVAAAAEKPAPLRAPG